MVVTNRNDATHPGYLTQLFRRSLPAALIVANWLAAAGGAATQERPTLREHGVATGILPTGRTNGIVDVAGVLVGHATLAGDSLNTGVTAVLPHSGNLFRDRVRAAAVVGNGFGKMVGFTQLQELGELESPILLTCTLCVHRAADALVTYMLELDGNEDVRSVNVVVGETNDGYLNDIRARPITPDIVMEALESASSGPVRQGSVGAGRGTVAFGWKGGIGTSSRVLPAALGGFTVGVLVQSNFGGVLSIAGVPVGRELNRYYLRQFVEEGETPGDAADGSIMIVVATDAPLSHRNIERLARRALAGLARTGSAMTNGSGDYVIAFSTVAPDRTTETVPELANSDMGPLFLAVIEATEEAIYNSMFTATTVAGHRGTVTALPTDSVLAIMGRFGRFER